MTLNPHDARLQLCANTSCKKGEGGVRQVFVTNDPTHACCSPACNSVRYRRARGWPSVDMVDLTPTQIEAKLEALAAKRKATRSWLRIEDPWAQRPGSALHHSAVVTHSVDMEGSYR